MHGNQYTAGRNWKKLTLAFMSSQPNMGTRINDIENWIRSNTNILPAECRLVSLLYLPNAPLFHHLSLSLSLSFPPSFSPSVFLSHFHLLSPSLCFSLSPSHMILCIWLWGGNWVRTDEWEQENSKNRENGKYPKSQTRGKNEIENNHITTCERDDKTLNLPQWSTLWS